MILTRLTRLTHLTHLTHLTRLTHLTHLIVGANVCCDKHLGKTGCWIIVVVLSSSLLCLMLSFSISFSSYLPSKLEQHIMEPITIYITLENFMLCEPPVWCY